jgi:hypothetical protein
MDQFLHGIFLSMEESEVLLDEIGQLPEASQVTSLPLQMHQLRQSIPELSAPWDRAFDSRRHLGADAWKYVEHQVGISLVEGAQAFISSAMASANDGISLSAALDDVETDLLSRATLTATQYSIRQLALEWIQQACDMLLSRYAPGAAASIAHPGGLLGWLLAGPVRLLGRYSALQVLRGQGWGDAVLQAMDRCDASEHVAIVAAQGSGELVLTQFGVPDAVLLEGLRCPGERTVDHTLSHAVKRRWQPRPPTHRGV